MEPLHALQTKLKQHLPQLDLRVAEPMAKHTTFRVGGPAALLALPKGEGEVRQILQLAHQMGVAPFFLGKGSNLLVADEGVDRFLVKLPGGLTRLEREGETLALSGVQALLAGRKGFLCQYDRAAGRDTVWSAACDLTRRRCLLAEGNPGRTAFREIPFPVERGDSRP